LGSLFPSGLIRFIPHFKAFALVLRSMNKSEKKFRAGIMRPFVAGNVKTSPKLVRKFWPPVAHRCIFDAPNSHSGLRAGSIFDFDLRPANFDRQLNHRAQPRNDWDFELIQMRQLIFTCQNCKEDCLRRAFLSQRGNTLQPRSAIFGEYGVLAK
jgi:hypothetical protein